MSTKTYKCPFCSYRATRENLGSHIEEEHEECIPKGMTANQIVFNTINHKDHGTCVVCKRPTKWNETACKYDRLCGRPQCQKALRDAYKKNMLRVHGKTTLLDDPEQQEKMLANRRISGKYKFTDGGYHVFTGKYEEKALEFMDKVMGFKSTDILSPGPTIEYIYKGKKLKWITDILLIPFNLVIEVKDGGSNPNNREMISYREKQLAKEQMITNMGKFNYLRLTDNDFSQLLGIVAELKAQMIDDSEENKKVIINVNEEVDMLQETCIDETVGSKFTKRYSGFNDLCKSIKTPSELNDWYNVNNIRWFTQDERVKRRLAIHSTNEDDVIVAWPDEIIKNHAGICFDHAIFMRLLCNRNSIENRMLYIGTIATNDKDTKYLGHIVCLYKIKDSGVYIFNYRANNEGSLQGPFGSYEEAEAAYKKYYFYITSLFLKLMPGKYHAKKVFSRIQKENLNVYDDYYNDRYATQAEIVKRIPEIWDMLAKVNKECHTDKITWLDEVLSKLDKIKLSSILKSIKGIFGESTINESGIDRYKKKYTSFDAFCKDMQSPTDVLNWVKVNQCDWPKEFNAKDRSKGIHFYWPDDILRTKLGTCIDFTLLMHFFCERKHIENYILRTSKYFRKYGDKEYHMFQHFMCIYKEKDGLYYVFNYQGKRSYGMKGPYSKPEDVRNEQLKMMKKHVMSVKNIIGKASDNDLCDIKYFAAIQDTKEYPIYDKFYGDKKIFRDDMMFKSKYMPSLICKYDSPNPEMHNDMYDNLKEKLTHLPKSIKAKLIYAASDWFNRTNDSMMESGELDDSVSTYEGESTNLSPIYYNYRGDNNMVLENAKPVKGPKELVRLYNNLEANFSYEERDDYFKDYKTKSPAEFEKLGYGICWDYADYEAKYLEKMGYKNTTADLSNGKYSLYYHQFNSDDGVNPTHTWVACMKGNKVYVVESSWYSFKGVHCFDNEQDMIAVYVSKLNEEKMPNLLMKYKPSRKFGLTTVKYMNHIYDTGTIVIDNVGMQESVSTYEGEYHSTDPNYESLIESVGVEHKERINYFISPKSEGAEILLANLACAGKDRFKEWFDPSEKFFSIIGKATASFYEKAGKEYEFLIIFNPKDTDADKRYNANQLCNYIQSMATGNGLVDTMRDKLFTYSGIMHIKMAKDLWLSYLILFGEDEIEKIFLVAYNMDTEWMELIPMPVPPMNTYRDSIAMEANLVPIPKPKDIKYIKSAEGIDNPYIMYDNKQYRVRVETLIFDKHGDVLVEMQDPKNLNKYGTNYKLPGGGLDKGRALDEQAEAECNEEALVVTKNRSYTGMTYFQNYEGKYPEWQKKKLWPLGLKYEGSLTFIFVAEYDKKFTGHIEDVDKDDFYQKAKYVGVDTIDWRAEHEEAIDFYFNHRDAIREGVDMDLNEFAGPGGMTPAPDLSYVTQYGPVHRDTGTGIMDMNVEGYAVSNDILTKNILTQDKSGMVKKENTEEFLKGRKLRVFQFRSDPEGLRIIENAIGTVQPRGFIYEALTGKKLLSDDQILCDESCTEVSPIDIGSEATSYLQTVAEQLKSIKGKKDHEFPLTNPHMIKEADAITEGLKDVVVMENQYGVYAKNAKTGMRTAYYQRIKDIPAKVVAKKNVKH
jgi:hypothetical protein